MTLPNELYDLLESRLATNVRHAVSVGGGMVSHAAKVVTEAGPVFVKWKPDARPGMFEAEADGLERLRVAGTLRVPRALAWGDNGDERGSALPFLVLEWIEPREPDDRRAFTRNFAAGLARMHQGALSPDGRFGLERDNFLGRHPQTNPWTDDWAAFYRDRRLLPIIALARERGRLNPERERRLERVAARVGEWLAHDEPACLIHGDLWSGNFLAVGDEAALIDPAVYYAHREVEMAYIQLFGGFPPGFVDAYHAEYPLDSGYTDRRLLLQLYPLLVHLVSFGESYGGDVDAVCRRYVG
jgi:fructosamine-3-kinase